MKLLVIAITGYRFITKFGVGISWIFYAYSTSWVLMAHQVVLKTVVVKRRVKMCIKNISLIKLLLMFLEFVSVLFCTFLQCTLYSMLSICARHYNCSQFDSSPTAMRTQLVIRGRETWSYIRSGVCDRHSLWSILLFAVLLQGLSHTRTLLGDIAFCHQYCFWGQLKAKCLVEHDDKQSDIIKSFR